MFKLSWSYKALKIGPFSVSHSLYLITVHQMHHAKVQQGNLLDVDHPCSADILQGQQCIF